MFLMRNVIIVYKNVLRHLKQLASLNIILIELINKKNIKKTKLKLY